LSSLERNKGKKMGRFTSLCKECDHEISWFLNEPQNYHCPKCGTYNSPKEINESWWWRCTSYQKIISMNGQKTLDEMKELFKDDKHGMSILNSAHQYASLKFRRD
jgi:hypothetical protein